MCRCLKHCSNCYKPAPGLAQDVTQGKDGPVQQLQQAVLKTVEKLVLTQRIVQTGSAVLGAQIAL